MANSPQGVQDRPQRNALIRNADDILRAHGIGWSPNKVINTVKQYEKHGHGLTLWQFLAKQIAQQLNTEPRADHRPSFTTVSGPRRRPPGDPTGNTAVRNVMKEQERSMPKYATLKEAAERFGISQTTLRRYVADQRITAHRVGPRLIRVDIEQVERELFGDNGTAA